MSRLTCDRNGYYLDGKPFRIISGTIHYFRVVPEYWEDRLKKLWACGMNTVETYVCWNLHEKKPGEFDFSGILDLARFLQTAKDLGLFVILRPGPYICAEFDKGGLPSWLETVPGLKIRCLNAPFLERVRIFYEKLFGVIRPFMAHEGGPVFAVQVENEYGSYGDDREYMKAVRKIVEDCGVRELMFTSDGPGYFMLSGGSIDGLPATINFGSNPRDSFALLRSFRDDTPLMCTEYWNGWFDHWYEEHHTRDAQDTAAVMKEMLDMGASVNMYMFHGGTNFGFCSGANYENGLQPTVTSYDYNCPVSECGDLTDKFRQVRDVILAFTGEKRELNTADIPKRAYGRAELTQRADLLGSAELISGEIHRAEARTPLSFEEIGQNFGFVLYSTVFEGPFEAYDLEIDGLADRAHVFVNGQLLGIKENTAAAKVSEPLRFGLKTGEKARVDILVENMGRINYGGHISDLKGITGGVRIANRYHFGWKMTGFEPDGFGNVAWEQIPNVGKEKNGAADDENRGFIPTIYRGILDADAVADTFIRLDGMHKGVAYINGFNLGRYWNDAGPQKTLYVPAPVLKKGENEIIIIELDGVDEPESPHVMFVDKEEL